MSNSLTDLKKEKFNVVESGVMGVPAYIVQNEDRDGIALVFKNSKYAPIMQEAIKQMPKILNVLHRYAAKDKEIEQILADIISNQLKTENDE